jgi:FkbM family methyltransferase
MADRDSNEDLPFRHYTLKHRLVAWISAHFFDTATYTVRHGLLNGMKRKGGLGWVPTILSPGVMTIEEQFWSSLNLSGMIVYDVGAFHGLLTLFFASRARKVVCFEPNTRNYSRLMENLELNGARNVEVRKTGVGSRHETRSMVWSPLMLGGSSVDAGTVEALLHAGVETVTEEIPIVTLDEEIAQAGLLFPISSRSILKGGKFKRSAEREISCNPVNRPCFSRCMARQSGRKGAKWPRLSPFCGRSATSRSIT